MEIVIFLLFAFVFGLVMASFFGSLSFRLETDKKYLLKKRSFCPSCKHVLSYKDLIPLFSYLSVGGKCRYCKKKISFSYPISEITVGVLWVFFAYGLWSHPALWNNQLIILNVLLLLVLSFLTVIDIFYYILPHELNAVALVVLLIINNFDLSPFRLWGVIVAVGFFLLLWVITKFKGIGLGDVGLAVWMGYGLGLPVVILGLMLSFIYGAVFGVGLMIKNKKGMKQAVPFGPFLVFGFVTAWFWGEVILKWYVSNL
ncbi:prepilin peptidase [Candidatus Curtissbacteria bacterium]|nr:prepilin peptidase [Candidatus Curtissbacteria bacterium]